MRDLGEHVRRWSRGRTCLVGVGDVTRGDDGFGVRLVQAVAARLRSCTEGPRPVLVEAGPEPERHLLALVDGHFDHVVFLDAVDFGGEPGTVLLADAAEMRSRLPQVSTHRLSLGLLAATIEARSRARAWLVGVQPASLARPSLSPAVRAALDVLSEVVSAPWQPGDGPGASGGSTGVSA